jgi:hypothetical protein
VAIRADGRLRDLLLLTAGYLPLSLLLGLGWSVALQNVEPVVTDQTSFEVSRYFQVFALPSAGTLVARLLGIVKLDGWAVPGLLALAIAGGLSWKTAAARCVAASALLTLAGYLLVPFDQGHGWGFRYFHQAWLTLPLLVAGALATFSGDDARARRYKGFLLVSCLGSLLVLTPLRMSDTADFVSRHLAQTPPPFGSQNRQIVFVNIHCGYHIQDLFQNDPFLRGSDLTVVSRGSEADARFAEEHLRNPYLWRSTTCANRWVEEAER